MALEWQWLDQKKQEWNDMQPGFRYLLIAVTVLGTAFITYNHFTRRPPQTSTSAALPAQTVAMPTPAAAPQPGHRLPRLRVSWATCCRPRRAIRDSRTS